MLDQDFELPQNDDRWPPKQMAILVEGGLAVAGLGLTAAVDWLWGISLWTRYLPRGDSLGRGLLATLPMLIAFWLLLGSPWGPLVRLKQQMEQAVHALLGDARLWELALISALAGIGEEILFRGVLQGVLGHWTTPWIGLLITSVLFGLAHFLSLAYFVVATVIGLYLGWLALSYGDVVAPMVAHGVYDFIALVYVLRGDNQSRPASGP